MYTFPDALTRRRTIKRLLAAIKKARKTRNIRTLAEECGLSYFSLLTFINGKGKDGKPLHSLSDEKLRLLEEGLARLGHYSPDKNAEKTA